MTTIYIDFDKNLTHLAGNIFGKSIYEKQIQKIWDFENDLTIIFPSHIKKIASSFIQGLFDNIIQTIGYSKMEEKITIISESIPNVKSIVLKELK